MRRGVLADHVNGVDPVREALRDVPIGDYAQRCGVDEELIRAAARRIGAAGSVAVFEDLGIQQAPNSTLCSYLNKLLWILTGNFAKRGGQHLHSSFGPLFRHTPDVGRTPVTGAPIVGGLVPSNVVPQEILTDHPDRFRGDDRREQQPRSFAGRLQRVPRGVQLAGADGGHRRRDDRNGAVGPLRPARGDRSTRSRESTFFNLEFPHNTFHLRHRLMEPLDGTLPEPEIWARLVRALDIVDDAELEPLRRAAGESREAFTAAFLQAVSDQPDTGQGAALRAVRDTGTDSARGSFRRGRTVGPGPEGGDGLSGGGAASRPRRRQCAVRRDPVEPSGCTFTVHEYEDDFALITHADHKIALDMPEMLDEIRALADAAPHFTTPDFPIVLSAGERRAYTANDIFRDPTLAQARRRRRPAGQPRGRRGTRPRRTAAGPASPPRQAARRPASRSARRCFPGMRRCPTVSASISSTATAQAHVPGVAPNALTSTDWRDAYAGTPWHKHVPARIEAVPVALSTA